MTALILLIGGQPLPNLLPALHLRPTDAVLAYTDSTKLVSERLQSLLEDVDIACHPVRCDAYAISITAKSLGEKLAKLNADEVIFNVTGGTKAMVLAANQLAMQNHNGIVYLESEKGKSNLYEYRYNNESNLQHQSTVTLAELLTLRQFLDAHIGKSKWEEAGPSKDVGGPFEVAVAQALLKNLPTLEILQGVKFLGNRDGKNHQADLDIVVRCGNQFARIECKNTAKATLDAMKQLNMVSELLGTYTRKIIALSRPPDEIHRAVYEATRTKVIELTSFSNGVLDEADERKLFSEVASVMNC